MADQRDKPAKAPPPEVESPLQAVHDRLSKVESIPVPRPPTGRSPVFSDISRRFGQFERAWHSACLRASSKERTISSRQALGT
jgi:hypothetical protein